MRRGGEEWESVTREGRGSIVKGKGGDFKKWRNIWKGREEE